MYLYVWIQIDFTESFIIKTILTGLFHNNMLLGMFNHGIFLTEKNCIYSTGRRKGKTYYIGFYS